MNENKVTPLLRSSRASTSELPFNPYKIGDLVWLKSGSPCMTVAEPEGNGKPVIGAAATHAMVPAEWFDVDLFLHRSEFHQDQLTRDPAIYPNSVVGVSFAMLEGSPVKANAREQVGTQDTGVESVVKTLKGE